MPFPREIYKDGTPLVVWSDEELAAKKAKGFTETQDGVATPPAPEKPIFKNSFPAEMFKGGESVVVWSGEELSAKRAKGWSEQKPVADPPKSAQPTKVEHPAKKIEPVKKEE